MKLNWLEWFFPYCGNQMKDTTLFGLIVRLQYIASIVLQILCVLTDSESALMVG